jgi:hypothetical protein
MVQRRNPIVQSQNLLVQIRDPMVQSQNLLVQRYLITMLLFYSF